MVDNRFDDVEERVRQLEATVEGLTDELVETRDRLRSIEEKLDRDGQPGIIDGEPSSGGAGPAGATDPAGGADAAGGTAAAGATDPAGATDTGGGAAGAADGDKGGTDEGEDNVDSGSSDDIIVA